MGKHEGQQNEETPSRRRLSDHPAAELASRDEFNVGTASAGPILSPDERSEREIFHEPPEAPVHTPCCGTAQPRPTFLQNDGMPYHPGVEMSSIDKTNDDTAVPMTMSDELNESDLTAMTLQESNNSNTILPCNPEPNSLL